MRKREAIESDGTRKDILTLEVLLDVRDLLEGVTLNKPKHPLIGTLQPLKKATGSKVPYTGKPRGRPKRKK